ncbi:alpha-1,2-fucosyltransferase [Pedobacter sp. AW1-32]|uniref:alpha-1,2-fucosyltransferase n=1 Tax=Pedobacter sp. AW1-32 TaxID=3383026 RepID=UPI003FEE0EF4
MVIINSQNAQLANRLWGFASFIANSIEYNYPLKNLGFHKYRPYFQATKSDDFGVYPISVKRSGIAQLDYLYSNLFKNWSSVTFRKFGKTPTLFKFYRTTFNEDKRSIPFNLNRSDFVRDAQSKTVLAEGWMFRDPENIRKHRKQICRFFTPVEPYLSQSELAVAKARKNADILVGVHIRRGDYATFADGRWFYTDEQYVRMMHEVANAYQAIGKTCAFFLCSNEAIEKDNYQGLIIDSSERNFIVDLYALAGCDAIIGPPSTFSQWAAYYGDKPLTMILNGNQKLGIPKYNPSLLADTTFPEEELYRF